MLALALAGALTVATAAAGARAPAARCPAHTDGAVAVQVTWGSTAAEDVSQRPAWLPTGYVERAAREEALFVRTVRTPQGRTAYLCAGERRLARLPRLQAGSAVLGASANGDRIAWRAARGAAAGRLTVGRIRAGRVVATRSVPTTPTGRHWVRDGRIVVTPRGDAAWALSSGTWQRERTGIWVWPEGRRPKRLSLPADHYTVGTLLLADDQHLFLDERPAPLTFAAPRRGSCPRLNTGRWQAVGDHRLAHVPGVAIGSDESESTSWLLVCDPASGRVVHVETETFRGLRYCASWTTVKRVASVGPRILFERYATQGGAACSGWSYRTTIVDTDAGTTTTAAGALAGAGIQAPGWDAFDGPPRTTDALDESGAWPAVALGPGAVAWAAEDEGGVPLASRHPVMLADAAGTRRVGTATTASLTADTALHWAEDGVERSAPITPADGWTVTAKTVRHWP